MSNYSGTVRNFDYLISHRKAPEPGLEILLTHHRRELGSIVWAMPRPGLMQQNCFDGKEWVPAECTVHEFLCRFIGGQKPGSFDLGLLRDDRDANQFYHGFTHAMKAANWNPPPAPPERVDSIVKACLAAREAGNTDEFIELSGHLPKDAYEKHILPQLSEQTQHGYWKRDHSWVG